MVGRVERSKKRSERTHNLVAHDRTDGIEVGDTAGAVRSVGHESRKEWVLAKHHDGGVGL
jgi:ribosomal protein S17